MKCNMFRTLGLCAVLCSSFATAAFSQAAKPAIGSQVPISQVYSDIIDYVAPNVISAAEAMPEDKYNFAPTQGEYKGVRTFAAMVKHIAQANYYYFGASEEAAKVASLTSKADIVQALKDSFAAGHKAAAALTTENAFVQGKQGTPAGRIAMGCEHANDHYGQLVEYLRMNGIVPPASRK
jgi:uncharacterized damage-inducible protein DinB